MSRNCNGLLEFNKKIGKYQVGRYQGNFHEYYELHMGGQLKSVQITERGGLICSFFASCTAEMKVAGRPGILIYLL